MLTKISSLDTSPSKRNFVVTATKLNMMLLAVIAVLNLVTRLCAVSIEVVYKLVQSNLK